MLAFNFSFESPDVVYKMFRLVGFWRNAVPQKIALNVRYAFARNGMADYDGWFFYGGFGFFNRINKLPNVVAVNI